MQPEVEAYMFKQPAPYAAICKILSEHISAFLPEAENKVWHGAPVWFLDGNPIVGISVQKAGVVLLFWSGQSFDEPGLTASGSFKAAQKIYGSTEQVQKKDLIRWLAQAKTIQWDYKNIVKRKGKLERIVQ